MLSVETRHAIHPETAKTFDTTNLRKHFHVGDIFKDGEIKLIYTHYDRMIVGGAVPAGGTLVLDHVKECGTASILDRRELVVVNIGGEGILSAPAHHTYPSRLIKIEDAANVTLGSQETSNERTIYQFVHPDVMKACQLVVGMTKLAPGSVWNTMPAHVHDRRMEAYLYFDLPEGQRAFHMMGEPDETRHLVLKNEEGAISPPWSIHSGAGTANYTFIWAMAGDNVDYKDVEMVSMETLK
jgi:4-deoxy-L-threo-5-hexosulose-uronate ketol-isomerase